MPGIFTLISLPLFLSAEIPSCTERTKLQRRKSANRSPRAPGRAKKHTQTQRYDEDNEERSFEGITYKMTRELASYVYRIIANNTRLIYPVQLDVIR